MTFFYNLFVRLYPFFIRVASIWNPKAALWINGRKNQFDRLQEAVGKSQKPIIWFHSASLGEFEQGRPVLEKMKADFPHYRILLTFFSPSGYEIRKNYGEADMVFYLPMDSKQNAKRFIEITQPKLAVFIKYETWFNYLNELRKRQTPTILISAVLYPYQFNFSPWASFMKKTMAMFSHIFAQSDDAIDLLNQHYIQTTYSLAGDTRYDRVQTLSFLSFQHQGIERFLGNSNVVVAGSTWPEDEKMLESLLNQEDNIKLIVAPHETTAKNIEALQHLFPSSLLYTDLDKTQDPAQFDVLIINCIGLLSKLYRFASIAYIGGGFNKAGIHNILEAAAYGKTVVFGPNFNRSNEAKEMIALELAHSYTSKERLANIISQSFENSQQLQEKNRQAKAFVEDRTGATVKIMDYIKQNKFI